MASREQNRIPARGVGTGNAARRTTPPAPAGRAVSSSPRRPETEKKTPEKKPNRVRYRWFTALLMVAATVVGCVFLSIFILESAMDLFGLNQPDKMIEINIPKGATNGDVAQILTDKGVVSKALTFMLYASIKAEEGDFKPGDYLFNANMSYDQIIVAMKNRTEARQVVTLTFREGRTVQEIANLLEEYKVCSADSFLEYLQTAELDYEFMDRMPEDELRFRRLEGYVFPDTYDFYIGESPQSVAAKFLNNFQRKFTEEMENKLMSLNLTLDEAITLASIIQKEAGDPDEMKMVSSVFHNRLRYSEVYPKLQSDVTIFYVNNFIKRYINLSNQDMYDAYNTYVSDGLPVGPICNPGLDAINAALNPADTDYYFFVTDINGVYYYSETAEEHYQNVRTAMAQTDEEGNKGEAHGTDVQGG